MNAQNKDIKMPPIGDDVTLTDYSDSESGFWCAGQLSGSYSTNLTKSNSPYGEFDFVGGYRHNSYLKIGLGLGGRYYFNNDKIRKSDIAWSMPIYLNVRGNIIDDTYRTVAPYYSIDLGGVIRDGFMLRPSIGMRVGQPRSAFLIGLTYTGQSLKYITGKQRFTSFVGVTVGYEY